MDLKSAADFSMASKKVCGGLLRWTFGLVRVRVRVRVRVKDMFFYMVEFY